MLYLRVFFTCKNDRFFRSIEGIDIQRLTNAAIDLGNLPKVSVVEVSSNAFDDRRPCQLITGKKQPVTVVVGGQRGKPCVSVILLNLNTPAS